MVFRRIFGKDKEEIPEWDEPTLETMAVGCLLDYDLKTWEVIAQATYDYDGLQSREWTLRSGDMVRFLEGYEEHGQMHWTLTREIHWSGLDEKIGVQIAEEGDPPEDVRYENTDYAAVEATPGLYYEGNREDGREFVSWSYEGADGAVLFLSQWGEREFTAFVGHVVEQYQFSNILPAAKE